MVGQRLGTAAAAAAAAHCNICQHRLSLSRSRLSAIAIGRQQTILCLPAVARCAAVVLDGGKLGTWAAPLASVRRACSAYALPISTSGSNAPAIFVRPAVFARLLHALRYDTIRYDTIRYDTIQYDTISISIRYDQTRSDQTR